MTRGIDAAASVHHALRARPANFVWVSDELLASTFAGFCQRRHGSCVPGPLESRRRASRRKNTSLAYPSAGDPNLLDSANLFGRGAHAPWWKDSQESSSAGSRTANWLSWLLGDISSNDHNDKILAQTPTSEERDASTIPWDGVDYDSVTLLLRDCTTLDEVQEALRCRNIKTSQRPRLCHQILSHLLEQKSWASDVSQFLLDPQFHPPDSSLHLEVLQQLQHLQLTQESWLQLRHSVCEAARLGIISIENLRKIIDASHGVILQRTDRPKPNPSPTLADELVPELLGALSKSSVLKLDNLGACYLSTLLQKLDVRDDSRSLLSLLGPWADTRHVTLYHDYVLLQVKRPSPALAQSNVDIAYSIAQLLSKVEATALLMILPQVTATLCHSGSLGAECLEKPLASWQMILFLLGKSTKGESLEKGVLFSGISDLPEAQRISALLTATWTCVSLCHSHQESQRLLSKLQVKKVLEQTVGTLAEPDTQDPLGRLTLELSRLPLPNKKFLLENLLPFIHNRSPAAASKSNLTKLIQSLVDRQYAVLRDDALYRAAWQNYPHELVDLAESINPHLDLFKTLTRKWIYEDVDAAIVIMRLLRQNHALKLALSKSSQDPNHVPYRIGQLYRKTHSLDQLPESGDALAFISHLAVSFATTNTSDPYSCHNKIYWLYLYLHRYRARIPPTVVQALWYNGLVRTNKTDQDSRQTRWLLDQVSKTEGTNVREMLESSAQFRQQRLRDFELLAQQADPVRLTKYFPELNRVDDLYWKRSREWTARKNKALGEMEKGLQGLPIQRIRHTEGEKRINDLWI